MTPFSASDAALEGFNLIRRRWRVVLGWAGFNLLGLVMLVVLTVMASFVAAALTGGAKGPVAAVAGVVVVLGGVLIQAILAAGVFRVEMRPEEPAFMHLRLGPDELRLVGVWLITLLAIWLLIGVATLLGVLWEPAALWAGLVLVVAGVYLTLRFLLAAPIAFAERRIDFIRSWRLTRGRVIALLGMTALSLSLIGVISLLVTVGLALVASGVGGLEGLAEVFGAGSGDALERHPGLYVLEFVVEIILTPVLWIVAMAPLAAAYRAFAGTPPDVP